MQLFSGDATQFKKNKNIAHEKLPWKIAHNRPQIFFSVLPTSPKSAQISYSVP